ncbi:MAG: type III-B CRISPR module RAMP protein Cmr4 [Methylococcales bacterium]|nr:type III-B CRISPR module RAMP protein Cmr4 [Methylococcales bacterium]
MTHNNAILGLLAQTSIHAGAGSQSGIIDLPIQREGHNGYPCVFGSAVKGAIRAKAEQTLMDTYYPDEKWDDENSENYATKIKNNNQIASIYGAPSNQVGEFAGALIVSDAKLLLFPVRSLTSQFKWVTCPDALRRYLEDSKRLGFSTQIEIPSVTDTKTQSIALVNDLEADEALFLEEYRFSTQTHDLSEIIDLLAHLMMREEVKQALEEQLLIISNDSFTHLVNHATPVNAHIMLDSLTKTTKDGALWYEETLPPETLLYISLTANAARKKGADMNAQAVLKNALTLFGESSPYLQLGGNETVGMGWCGVSINEGA